MTTAWTVLEMCCRDALEEQGIGNRFKDDINAALNEKGLNSVNWGSGLWQKVIELKELRREYTHIDLPQKDLWPDIQIAENAINIVREASKDIYLRANKPFKSWLEDDSDRGWE